ncbi:MAG TPA: hypothetical protein VGG28_05985 [Kofleriaceae bacterium]|jgi:hypothetical protein
MKINTLVASVMLVLGLSTVAIADPAPQAPVAAAVQPTVIVVKQQPSTLDRVTDALTSAAFWTAYELTVHHHGR